MPLPRGFLAYGLIAVFTFAMILIVLVRYPMTYGIDGPYYIVQVRHLSISLLRSESGLKVEVAFYVALTSIIFYLAIRGGSDGWTASAAVLLLVVSPYTPRLSMDFIKNPVDLFFTALFLFSVYIVKGMGKAALISGLSAISAATHMPSTSESWHLLPSSSSFTG